MDHLDIARFPLLTTERLLMREIVANDAEYILRFRGDPEVEKWNTKSTNVLTGLEQAREWVEDQARHFWNQESICWGITLRGETSVIGFVDLGYNRSERIGSLGYMIARAYWRQGITTEAVRAAIRFAFERLIIHRLNINTRTDNLGSMRMMEKLGIPCEGIIRECALGEDGSYQNWAWFGLLEQEYPHWAEQNKLSFGFAGISST